MSKKILIPIAVLGAGAASLLGLGLTAGGSTPNDVQQPVIPHLVSIPPQGAPISPAPVNPPPVVVSVPPVVPKAPVLPVVPKPVIPVPKAPVTTPAPPPVVTQVVPPGGSATSTVNGVTTTTPDPPVTVQVQSWFTTYVGPDSDGQSNSYGGSQAQCEAVDASAVSVSVPCEIVTNPMTTDTGSLGSN